MKIKLITNTIIALFLSLILTSPLDGRSSSKSISTSKIPLDNDSTNVNFVDGKDNYKVNIKLLTSTPVYVGDPIDIILSIDTNRDFNIDFPRDDSSFYPFHLNNYQVKEKKRKKQKSIFIYYTLTPLYAGKALVPPLTVKINGNLVKTSPIDIYVKSNIKKDDKRDINDIVGPLGNGKYIFIIVFFAIIIFIIILFYRKKFNFSLRKKKINFNNIERNITYDPILTSILSIYAIRYNHKISIKDRYYKLSSLLKRLLGEMLDLNLMPLTTNRIKDLLHKNLSSEFYEYLSKKLDKYDEIKYSKRSLETEYKFNLEKEFPEETEELLLFLYSLLKAHYRKMVEVRI